jgi:ferredoxin-nitrite reductase
MSPAPRKTDGQRDEDRYGIATHGLSRAIPFVRPYRWVGELNDVERAKLDRHPYEAVQAVVDRYAKEGPGAIAAVAGEAERLKWAGLYPQRQGGDAFMLRIKVPGGALSAAQVREIGAVADAFAEGPAESRVFGNRYADLTTRQDIQLHWIHIGDVPRIWQRLASVGLTTLQACGDSTRNVCCCPVSGIDAEEVVDALAVARRLSAFFTGNREYANLPRKFKIAVTGCLEDCARVEIDDIGLWPARDAAGTVGFNVLVGGGLSDGERLASDIDVFVEPERALGICQGIARVFAELGNRENRGLSRMRYLVQELGPEGFRTELAARVDFELAPAGKELTRTFRGDHIGVHPQRQPGLVYVGCCVPVGRMRGVDLVELGRLADTYGDGTIRIGTDQNFLVPGVRADRVDDLLAEPLLQTYSPFPGPVSRGIVACTGSEFCRFAVVETKERAATWARTLDARIGALIDAADHDRRDEPAFSPFSGGEAVGGDPGVLRVHFSGCSASCAQPQIADVGLRGDVAHVRDQLAEAADIGLGGSLGPEAGFIRWIAGAVPLEQVPDALVGVYARYLAERRADEPFYRWARRRSPDELRAALAGKPTGVQAAVRTALVDHETHRHETHRNETHHHETHHHETHHHETHHHETQGTCR